MKEHRIHILLIEPDLDRAKEYLSTLRAWGHDVDQVDNHLLGLSRMEDFSYDLVLVSMEPTGGIRGCEFCKLVRRREEVQSKAYTGLVLLGEERHLESVVSHTSGADDFLIKPFLPAEMQWRLLNCYDKVHKLRQLKGYLQRTPEDNFFEQDRLDLFVQQVLKRSLRRKTTFSILLIRLKGFELAKLGYGAVTVMNMEKHVLDRLCRLLRSEDLIGRLNTGNYCVLALDLNLAGLEGLRDRVELELDASLNAEYACLDIQFELQGLAVDPDFAASDLEQPVKALENWLLNWADGHEDAQGLNPVVLTRDGFRMS